MDDNTQFLKQAKAKEIAETNMRVIEMIGQDKFIQMESLLYQFESGLRNFFMWKLDDDGITVDGKLELLRKAGGNIFGQASSLNSKPVKIAEGLKKLIEETNF